MDERLAEGHHADGHHADGHRGRRGTRQQSVVLAGLPAPYRYSLSAALHRGGFTRVLTCRPHQRATAPVDEHTVVITMRPGAGEVDGAVGHPAGHEPDHRDRRSRTPVPGSAPGSAPSTATAPGPREPSDPPAAPDDPGHHARAHHVPRAHVVHVVHVVPELTVDEVAVALRGGALAVVALNTPLEVAVRTVRAAAEGFSLLPHHIARELAAATSHAPRGTPGQLVAQADGRVVAQVAPHERAWLRALAGGSTVAELVQAAGSPQEQVHRALGRLYQRLGAANRTQALLHAQRLGLLG